MQEVRAKYFDDLDVVHVALSEEQEAASVEIYPDVTAELNDRGEIIGIEILGISRLGCVSEPT